MLIPTLTFYFLVPAFQPSTFGTHQYTSTLFSLFHPRLQKNELSFKNTEAVETLPLTAQLAVAF